MFKTLSKTNKKNNLNNTCLDIAIPLICAVVMIVPQLAFAMQVDQLAIDGTTITLEEDKVKTIKIGFDEAVSGTLVLRTDTPVSLQSDLTNFHVATKDGKMVGNFFEPSSRLYPAVIQFTGITPSSRPFTVLSASTPQEYYVLLGIEPDQSTTASQQTTPVKISNQTLLDGFDKFVVSNKSNDTRIPLEREILQELLSEGKTDDAVSLAQVYMSQITNETSSAGVKVAQCNNARISLEQAQSHFASLPQSLQKNLSEGLARATQEINASNCGASLIDSEKVYKTQPNILDSVQDQLPYILLATMAIPGIVVVRKIRGGGGMKI